MKILKKKLKISKNQKITSMKSKRLRNGFLSVCAIILSTILCAFIHEIGHIIALMYFNVEIHGFYTDGLYLAVKSEEVTNPDKLGIILLSGGLFACVIYVVVFIIGRQLKNITCFTCGFIGVFYNILYWSISPIVKKGDTYRLLMIQPKINPILFITACWLLLLIWSLIMAYIVVDFDKIMKQSYYLLVQPMSTPTPNILTPKNSKTK